MQLSFADTQKPLAVAAVLQAITKAPKCEAVVSKDVKEVSLKVSDDLTLIGEKDIITYLLTTFKCALMPTDATSKALCERWIALALGNPAEHAKIIDGHLLFRPFLLDGRMTIADVILASSLTADAAFPNISRYLAFMATQTELVKGTKLISQGIATFKRSGMTKPVSESAKKAQAKVGKKTGVQGTAASFGLADGKMGEVVTRFPPEPSGYLHIGHVKAAMLNHYVAEIYKGKMLFRLDDTNPTKENIEFVDNIQRDLKTLGITWSSMSYTSDHFDYIMQCAEKMIREGNAYVDNSDVNTMRDQRLEGIESACRANSVEKNLEMWEAMKTGADQTCVLRAKIDMKSPNGTMRDPVLYRYSGQAHHRTGTKYLIYPTYDLAVPIVDSIEGVTHALRTLEFQDRNEQYQWIAQALGLRCAKVVEFSRMNLVNTVLSKRKLQKFVDDGIVDGWWDPRFPTVQGIIRRGLTVQALREFVVSQGQSRNSNYMEWEKLWVLNKKIIDPIAPRFVGIESDMVDLTLTNVDSTVTESRPLHKKNPAVGEKSVLMGPTVVIDKADATSFKVGEKVTLMDWGNIVIEEISETGVKARLTLEDTDFKGTAKITWLAKEAATQPATMIKFGHLVTKKIPEDGDDPADFLNPESKVARTIFIDPKQFAGVKKGDIIQIERKGFCYVDEVTEVGPVLHLIPDGRKE
ncbi:Glutamyl/glutaminyl-tRNA synthetase [Carpediemonas membranifera]|uniref:glutamate--tRNA ligase n=1 Tax=Carpediemonas membranifera TaxID=201153 RepID=A0A8J6EB63_9EUKA|nr:Glutamyl/glutaminyl-tRNA synthetase [Carpediemonas membranifera]|eukprot:KAG9396370.1 Glutamyl/glutaminyl-tRNA synthetase [Carpediemonas membranifera]